MRGHCNPAAEVQFGTWIEPSRGSFCRRVRQYGATEGYAPALQKCGATARLVQLQILDLDTPSHRKSKPLTCEGESPDYGLSQSLAGKPTINAG